MEKVTNDNLITPIQKRGRGRPRKNQIINEIDKNKKNKNINEQKIIFKEIKKDDDEIILHLPISFKDLSLSKENTVFEKKTSDISNENNNSNIFTINDINSETNSDSYNDDSNNEIDNTILKELKLKNKELEKIINKLENKVNEYKLLINDNNIGINSRVVSKMKIEFISILNGKSIIIEKTDIACWWCTYNFDTVPCFIPDKYYDNKYYVFGCFCCFECAAAYNLNSGDSYMWNRYSLLRKLYNISHDNNDEILVAPPREVFEKFGGPLSHNEFRKNCIKCTKEYRFIMPPMASIIPLIEEGHTDSTKVNISLADLNKKSILKRTKPLPNVKNNLFETLGIKESTKK